VGLLWERGATQSRRVQIQAFFLLVLSLGLDPLFPLLSGCFRRMGVREVTFYNAFSMIASRSRLLAEVKDSAADDGWMEKWWRSLQDNY
jgi:hypothetical protein